MPEPFKGEREQFPAYLSDLISSVAASKDHSALYYLFMRNTDGYVTDAKKKAMQELSSDLEAELLMKDCPRMRFLMSEVPLYITSPFRRIGGASTETYVALDVAETHVVLQICLLT